MAGHVFRLPDVGEGLTEAEIVRWLVAAGDEVQVNTPIVEIETAKSLVELPSPVAGVVSGLLAAEGDLVAVGSPIIEFGGAEQASEPAADQADRQSAPETAAGQAGSDPGETRQAVLVGYGPRAGGPRTRRQPRAVPEPDRTATRPAAKPPVRKLARDLGVDLNQLSPSGPAGLITREDVTAAAAPPESAGSATPAPAARTEPAAPSTAAPAVPATGPSLAAEPGPTGRLDLPAAVSGDTRIPVRGIRRATAEAMVASAFTAPQVTVWLSVDATRTARLVRREASSLLLAVARSLLLAVRRHPMVNSRWDEQAGEIVVLGDVHLGIAAATERGLLVPVVRDAGRRSPADLATELTRVIGVARDGSAGPAELTGGTITITNVGVFGVDGGTPILPPGQAAILGVGQLRPLPWVHKGRVRPRQVLPLTLSFDHRIIDGDTGSRFLADVGRLLERPDRALLG